MRSSRRRRAPIAAPPIRRRRRCRQVVVVVATCAAAARVVVGPSTTASPVVSSAFPPFLPLAEAVTSSSSSEAAERERRRRRREREEGRKRRRDDRIGAMRKEEEERERRRRGFDYIGSRGDDGGSNGSSGGSNRGNDGGSYYINDDDDDDEAGDAGGGGMDLSIHTLFVTRRPRDVFDGLRSAVSNALRGGFYGLAALVASPVGGMKFGVVGVLGGLATGVVLGAALPLAGLIAGGYQVLRGAAETPTAILDGFVNCKVYDETGRVWVEYRLDDDMEDILKSMKEEEEEGRRGDQSSSSSRSSDGRQSSTSGGGRRKVKSTEYYDLLDVDPDASPSAIRSAYRRRARRVHPDKNPDDPRAESKFRELSAAYQTLSDPARRSRYDATGVGVDPTRPEGGGGDGSVMIDPIVFFAVLFGSETVEPYVGELSISTTFDTLVKLGGQQSTAPSFESWEDVKSAFGWGGGSATLRRRKRETEIAIHLRKRVGDYVEGYMALDAYKDGCWEEAVGIAKGGGYGASFLLAIGPALVAEADAFLGYRSSVLGSWRGPLSNAKRNFLFLRRRWGVTKSVLRTVRESVKALYHSAEVVPFAEEEETHRRRHAREDDERGGGKRKPKRVVFEDRELLKDNLSNTIPTVLEMAWAINYVDISNTLYAACGKLFHDADVSSWEERLRRAEAVHILGSQFYLVGLEVAGGNKTTTTGDVDDIKARANEAFMESLKSGMEKNDKKESDERSTSDEM